MKRTLCIGSCAVGVLLSGCQTLMSVDPVAEASAIKAQDAAWVAAIASKDVGKVVSFYTDDALLLPPNAEAKKGEALKKEWADTLALPNLRLTFSPTRVEVDAAGQMASDVGTYDFSFDSPKGKIVDRGKYAQTWKKENGVWKCSVDMYNSSEASK